MAGAKREPTPYVSIYDRLWIFFGRLYFRQKKNRLERIGKEGSASYEWMKWMDEIQVASLIDDGYIIRYKTRTTRY